MAEANFRLARYGLPKVDVSTALNAERPNTVTVTYLHEKQLEELRALQVPIFDVLYGRNSQDFRYSLAGTVV